MSTYLELIETKAFPSGSVGAITFSSIPQSYADLMLVISVRAVNSGLTSLLAQFNGNTTGIYSSTVSTANGSSLSSFRTSNATNIALGVFGGSDYTSGIFSSISVLIPSYSSTVGNKATISESSPENVATATQMRLSSGLWRSNSAIDSITLSTDNGQFAQHSVFSLYGIKGTV
jgi:hypothetical protein